MKNASIASESAPAAAPISPTEKLGAKTRAAPAASSGGRPRASKRILEVTLGTAHVVNQPPQVGTAHPGLGDGLLRGLVEADAREGDVVPLGCRFPPAAEAGKDGGAILLVRGEAKGDRSLAGDEPVRLLAGEDPPRLHEVLNSGGRDQAVNTEQVEGLRAPGDQQLATCPERIDQTGAPTGEDPALSPIHSDPGVGAHALDQARRRARPIFRLGRAHEQRDRWSDGRTSGTFLQGEQSERGEAVSPDEVRGQRRRCADDGRAIGAHGLKIVERLEFRHERRHGRRKVAAHRREGAHGLYNREHRSNRCERVLERR